MATILTIERSDAEKAMDMKRVMGITAGAVLCVALTSYCRTVSSQQPRAIAPRGGQAAGLR